MGKTLPFGIWYEKWSKLGCLKDLLGDRGTIVLGIADNAVVSDVLSNHRRRNHRVSLLNDIENELAHLQDKISQCDDVPMWKQSEGKYASVFSAKKT